MNGAEFLELRAPKLNANDKHVDVLKWKVENGSYVEASVDVIEVESSKATVMLQSPQAGYVIYHINPGESAVVGSVIATFHSQPQEKSTTPNAKTPTIPTIKSSVASTKKFGFTRISDKAAQLIESNKLDANLFDNLGFVTTDIVASVAALSHPRHDREQGNRGNKSNDAQLPTKSPLLKPHTRAAETPQPDQNFRHEAVSSTKRREIEFLTAGQSGLINSSLTVQFPSEKIRDLLQQTGALGGQVLPIILFEFAKMLKQYPQFLSFYEHGYLHYYDHVHLGIAIDFGEELRVPVIRFADTKTAADIGAEVVSFGVKYLNHELTVDELTGGSVTITDLSSYDILAFQPLLNQRQSIILGIGGDKTAPGMPMTLTLVFDHRVLSGRIVAEFLKKLKTRILAYEKAVSLA